jgi:hypothetical protein
MEMRPNEILEGEYCRSSEAVAMTCRLVCLCVRRAAPVCGESLQRDEDRSGRGCQREMPRTDIEAGSAEPPPRMHPSGRVTALSLGRHA